MGRAWNCEHRAAALRARLPAQPAVLQVQDGPKEVVEVDGGGVVVLVHQLHAVDRRGSVVLRV